ncbi:MULTISPECIES: hypothetical protein [Kitasatospora]|uniref:hypothetical protein n=1 Tax=Kitasatospora TaxID=2063 RepID=UPI000527802C|nr:MULTISPECIES: hypothetical protein [Kitasatospora]
MPAATLDRHSARPATPRRFPTAELAVAAVTVVAAVATRKLAVGSRPALAVFVSANEHDRLSGELTFAC